jgi:hypothetical protein
MKKRWVMNKGLITILCLLVLMVTSIPVSAQRTRRSFDGRRYDGRRYEQRVTSDWRNDRRYRDRWDDRSFWERHRDKLTTAIGAGSGAAVGAVVGGKKGAIIGAIVGGGGAAIYTYGIRDKDDDNWRRRRY